MAKHNISGPTSRFFFSQRLRLHYVDWGNPDAPPMVLVHGGRDHCRSWDWVAEHFRRDYRIIAPDLRGHGDSAWSATGSYAMTGYVYDLAQLIHQLRLAPVTIVAHSLGGSISLRYTGLYPEHVKKIVAIEGLGRSPRAEAERVKRPMKDRLRTWIDEQRALAGRQPRRYGSIEEAIQRMQDENKRLSPEQARHLTHHGVNQNEDGTYSWKFDNYLRSWIPYEMETKEVERLWAEVTCPALMLYGRESQASNPLEDGRAKNFKSAQFEFIDKAGHWVHHDQLDTFVSLTKRFLG